MINFKSPVNWAFKVYSGCPEMYPAIKIKRVRRQLLTPYLFINWLRGLPSERSLGMFCDPYNCPVGHYLHHLEVTAWVYQNYITLPNSNFQYLYDYHEMPNWISGLKVGNVFVEVSALEVAAIFQNSPLLLR